MAITAEVISVNSSPGRGTPKYPVSEGKFIENYGLLGDGHAGEWHRQVCLFDVSAMDSMSAKERKACEATYSENITTRGITPWTLAIGTQIEIGDTILAVTQIGKDFTKVPSLHTPREVIMHEKGVFCVVRKTGVVKAGDPVKVLE
jgi:MOSC domain-containing protein YiiM